MKEKNIKTYKEAGVDTEKGKVALQRLLRWTVKTFNFRDKIGSVKLKEGYFANVIKIGEKKGIAISTDGVGTKILIAQMMEKYDTIGIDCVAMNVNDILCVGAEPVSMVDYIAVTEPNPELLDQIGKGLYKGAKLAKINIPGGEIAQIKEIIKGKKEGYEFDLVGTAIGIVDLEHIIIGQDIKKGDVVVALASSGIHSNGLTLARKVLIESGKFKIDDYLPELGKTLGEELLEPTLIYAPAVVCMMRKGINIKGLVHITGDGFLNLLRVSSPVSFLLDNLPPTPPIFSLIQKIGGISDEEMFTVFNMGIGFCLIVSDKNADEVQKIAKEHNLESWFIGKVCDEGKKEIIISAKKIKLLPK